MDRNIMGKKMKRWMGNIAVLDVINRSMFSIWTDAWIRSSRNEKEGTRVGRCVGTVVTVR